MMGRKVLISVAFLMVGPGSVISASPEYFRMARLSYLSGNVSFQHSGDVDWVAADINMPLQPDDRIYTGVDGRVEIQFDDGSTFRMAERSDAELVKMNEDWVQIRLLQGLSALSVQSSVDFEVSTPTTSFHTLRKGIYRFFVAENGDTDGIVRKGLMEIRGGESVLRLEAGEMVYVTQGPSPAIRVSRYDRRDGWDEWNDRRNADLIAGHSRQYLPDDVFLGARELDQYGRWVVVSEYGPAWVPAVSTSWYPYWEGRWAYRPSWGWTWISYEPWGWLPYHYGRWYFSTSYGWCWLPGPAYGFYFWAPALVRFYQGPDWLSWCPLGPGDYYNVNFFHYNRRHAPHLNQLRLLQTRAPSDVVNRSVPGAVRGVRLEQFANQRFGGRSGIPSLDASRLGGRSEVVLGELPVRPPERRLNPPSDRIGVRTGDLGGRDRRDEAPAPALNRVGGDGSRVREGYSGRSQPGAGVPNDQRLGSSGNSGLGSTPQGSEPSRRQQSTPGASRTPSVTGRDGETRSSGGSTGGAITNRPAVPAVPPEIMKRGGETPSGDRERRPPVTSPPQRQENSQPAPNPRSQPEGSANSFTVPARDPQVSGGYVGQAYDDRVRRNLRGEDNLGAPRNGRALPERTYAGSVQTPSALGAPPQRPMEPAPGRRQAQSGRVLPDGRNAASSFNDRGALSGNADSGQRMASPRRASNDGSRVRNR